MKQRKSLELLSKQNGVTKATTTTTTTRKEKNKKLVCSFCSKLPAKVVVQLQSQSSSSTTNSLRPSKERRIPTPLCWLHYYTSRAVRQVDSKFVTFLASTEATASDNNNVQRQEELESIGLQELFAESYVELKEDLSREAAQSFAKQKKDPLAILQSFQKSKNNKKSNEKKRNAQSPSRQRQAKKLRDFVQLQQKQQQEDMSGGFLPQVPLPDRFQQTQNHLQQELSVGKNNNKNVNPMNLTLTGNPYERRKASRSSIWNIAMDKKTYASSSRLEKEEEVAAVLRCPACNSTDVGGAHQVMSRNMDVNKGETWGYKDRSDEIVQTCHCHSCGKRWNNDD